MIEFKAECGHTVRAKDEDAGGVVRCSYCGRTAAVPETEGSNLDFLFSELDQDAQPRESGRRRWRRLRPLFPRRVRKPGEFSPFGIVLNLCYFAILVAIVIVVARKVVIPLFDDEQLARRFKAGKPATPPAAKADDAEKQSRTRGPGLIRDVRLSGLYVASTPPRAAVYYVDESRAPNSGRIQPLAAGNQFLANGDGVRCADGTYVVEVAFPWNHPSMSDPSLSNYQNYLTFRRAIERASAVQRKQLVEEYFIPDEASTILVDETEDQIYIVRQYRGVVVRQGQSKGVRALFLPRIGQGEGKPFSIEPLVLGYIPPARTYVFDETHVRSELAYYGVAETDQRFIIESLTRIGLIPYMTADRRVRMFKIDVHDGTLTTKVLREAPP